MPTTDYPGWLVRLLSDYPHLRSGAPIGQFRDHDPEAAIVPHWVKCAYCNESGRPCTHEAPRTVGKDVATLEPQVSWWNLDLMVCRQLAADIDRLIDPLPGLAYEVFHRRYRTWYVDIKQTADGVEYTEVRTKGLPEVAKELRLAMADVIRCHDFHLRDMAVALADWAPKPRRGQVA